MQILASIPYSSLPFHNKLVKDYISGKELLSPFYSYQPTLEGILQAAANKQFPKEKRMVLHDCLKQQYSDLATSEKVGVNIASLLLDNAYTITTGHQLCIYGGPAYFIYKICTVLNLVSQLELANPEKKFIPVFWMASEDHDFEEISEVHFYGKQWKWEKEDATFGKVPVGILNAKTAASWAEEMRSYFRNESMISAVLTEMEIAYATANSLAEATRIFLNSLFKVHGLLVLDGNDAALKKMFAAIMAKEISSEVAHPAVVSTTKELEKLGYGGQIVSREVNLFYLNESQHRERIDKMEQSFHIASIPGEIPTVTLLKEVANTPEKFSPNVVLRPVFQEYILPNIAYVGGPAEVAYWLQLKAVFTKFEVQFPVLLPRCSFLTLPLALEEKRAQSGISITSYLTATADDLVKIFMEAHRPDEFMLNEERELLAGLIKSIQAKANKTDKQLLPQIAGEEKQLLDVLSKIQSKFNKSTKQKFDSEIKSIQRLKNHFFPNQTFQERNISFFDCFEYNDALIPDLITASNPFDYQLKVTNK